ncbi:MAG TPA: DUF2007 domain-containing protein [Myxococcales bacterium]|nr:DUF2007 domain-containing protein [Myxococcales bacterium]
MADDSRLTELTTCADSGEAGALRSRLEAEGIPCVVQGEHHHALLGSISGGIIEVRVLVPEAAVARARELLAEWDAAEPASGLPEGPLAEPKEGEARCAEHGGPSVGTCARCGAFVCEACVGDTAGDSGAELICPSCDALTQRSAHTPRRRATRALATVMLLLLGLPILLAILLGGLQMVLGR